ncbi:MAG: hypothetical protein AAF198_11865 [Pseudomonadota bacterium]
MVAQIINEHPIADAEAASLMQFHRTLSTYVAVVSPSEGCTSHSPTQLHLIDDQLFSVPTD